MDSILYDKLVEAEEEKGEGLSIAFLEALKIILDKCTSLEEFRTDLDRILKRLREADA